MNLYPRMVLNQVPRVKKVAVVVMVSDVVDLVVVDGIVAAEAVMYHNAMNHIAMNHIAMNHIAMNHIVMNHMVVNVVNQTGSVVKDHHNLVVVIEVTVD